MASEGTERHFSTTDDAAQRWTQRRTLRTTFGQDPPVLVVFLVLALIWSAASQVCPLLCARSYLECCFAVSCLPSLPPFACSRVRGAWRPPWVLLRFPGEPLLASAPGP